MPYRKTPAPKTGRHVEARAFLDPTSARLALDELEDAGVPGFVVEGTGMAVVASPGGSNRLMVDEADAERADEILRRADIATVHDDEPEGTIRCPRCELPYCTLRRPPLRGVEVLMLLSVVLAPLLLLRRPRWCCDKCDHVWDSPKAGPARATELHEDDPRPVFLLFRGHAATGGFIGLVAGVFAAFSLLPSPGALVAPLLIVAGWLVGRTFGKFQCSEPGCRTVLPPNAETCPRCHGIVAGRIKLAAEHYAYAADVRRELAAERAVGERKAARRLAARPA